MSDRITALHVAVAIIRDSSDRILIARRAAHQHQGDRWEFPGGKVEAGEDVGQALARELDEELGIQPLQTSPLLRLQHSYSDRLVDLDVWTVNSWFGSPKGREGQAIRWIAAQQLNDLRFPAANLPIIRACQLPRSYLITPVEMASKQLFLQRLEAALERGITLVQFRMPALADRQRESFALDTTELCHKAGARLLVNADWQLARRIGADGVHLNSRQLMAVESRPFSPPMMVSASCHNDAELSKAASLNLDFAVLSPVMHTPSHPNAMPLGWKQFADIANGVSLPVYALGGVGQTHMDTALNAGAQGIAGIRSLWNA